MTDKKQLLVKFLTSGSVDDGKSTLIGNLLYNTDSIYDDQISEIKKLSGGDQVDYSLFVEGLESERRQKITIDVAYRYFTAAGKKFIIADSPGHEEYTRNMAVAASNSELALLLVDAKAGLKVQTLRHLYIAYLFGIRRFVVVINKMDLADYSQDRFNDIRNDFIAKTKGLEFADLYFIPVVAISGDNVVKKSKNISWYKGDTLYGYLTKFNNPDQEEGDFRFRVQVVSKHQDYRLYQGIISGGNISANQEIMALPGYKSAKVKEIHYSGEQVKKAHAGQSVSLVLDRDLDIDRGTIFAESQKLPQVANGFSAHVIWFSKKEFSLDKNYDLTLKLNHNYANAEITKINHLVNINDFSTYDFNYIRQNQIAHLDFSLAEEMAFDKFADNKFTGSFLLINKANNEVMAAGLIDKSINQLKQKNRNEAFLADLAGLVKRHFGQQDAEFFINHLKG